jgi:membrane-associated phospholipid phosphatase
MINNKKLILSLRIEEFLAILLFIPMLILLLLFRNEEGFFQSDIDRLIGTVIGFALFIVIVKMKEAPLLQKHPITRKIANLLDFLREIMPFILCLLIYTNMHDMVHFVNPNDVDNDLIRIDDYLFGTQPSLALQAYISKPLTDYMSFSYSMFFVYPMLLPALLYFKGDYENFRKALVSIIITFYIGYIGYIIFPAVGPKYTLSHLYHTHLGGGMITDKVNYLIDFSISAHTRRDCFPSLHNAVTLLTLLFAYKYLRWFFYILLPLALSLFFSTIYLRQHYFIDVVAGYALALFMFYYGPKIETFWSNKRRQRVTTKE